MISQSSYVVAIGQLPPPVTGLSYITSRTVKVFEAAHSVHVANIATKPGLKGPSKHVQRMLRVLAAGAVILKHSSKPGRVCYLVCEGDWGIIYIIFLATLARICAYPTLLHHHSFAYVDRPRALLRLLLRAGGPSLVHIFLCQTMATKFAAAYGVKPIVRILSNSAFVKSEPKCNAPTGPLTLGLLSNLTKEKGLHTFLELMRRLHAEGSCARGVLAGPIASKQDRKLVESACQELGEALEYRGPLYGDMKKKFYEDIDLFIFPTEYAHEAEPTVLFEALSAGALVIASDRGCIASQLKENGLVVPNAPIFIETCIEYVRRATLELSELRRTRRLRREAYQELHLSSIASANELLCASVT